MIILFIVLIVLTLFWIFKTKIKGKLGEFSVYRKLKKINGGIVLNNITFRANENKTCQIDHILVCSRGVFVIETKTYAGRIYGNDSELEWTQVLQYGNVKNKFYSPVKQNKTHIYELGQKIFLPYVYNCVVFKNTDISQIKSEYVFSIWNINRFIMSQLEVYSSEDVNNIAEKIVILNEKISNRKHVKNIKKMKKDIKGNICPRCGSDLVLRTGKFGQFYGCSNYPKCKFIKKK